jgi:parallel beta-helix repeat protein
MSGNKNLKTCFIICLILLTLHATAIASGKIIYVDDDANGLNNGSSWANAYKYIEHALYAVIYGDVDEVRVAQGVYKPTGPSGSRERAFQLVGVVPIKGGYAGVGTPDPNARDIELYKTILSGDLDGNDVDVNDPCDLLTEPTRAENSYNVATIGYWTPGTVMLDGFTITGSSIYAISIHHSDAIITDCIFINNGGAMNMNNSRAIFTRCWFIRNAVAGDGGAVNSWGCDTCRGAYAEFKDCRLINNYAGGNGGALYNSWPTLTNLINCIVAGNIAEGSGGGIYYCTNDGCHLVNCTFTGNSANQGSGLYNNVWYFPGWPTLTNCIFWDNDSDQISGEGVNVTFSDIEGGWPGEGNSDFDPCFVSPGYWDANGVWVDGDYHLLPCSPCINSGDPNYIAQPSAGQIPGGYYFNPYDPAYIAKSSVLDLDSKHRVSGGRVDMGAYEYQTVWYWYVDDNAPDDPGPGDPGISDPLEDGTKDHPFDAIQEAIDAAINGDVVVVAEGTYFENINFKGKNITLRGIDPNNPDVVANTIIDGGQKGSVVTFNGVEDANCILEGFAITNGSEIAGGGIDGRGSSATIRNCVISGNSANCHIGGGMYKCNGMVSNCIITTNTAPGVGGGLGSCHAMISNCTIISNTAGTAGGGLGYCSGTITNCIITDNRSGWYGGGLAEFNGTITNCTISGNSAGDGGAIYSEHGSGPTLANCIL